MANYPRISAWQAKRSGGRITVYGKDEAGKDIKVPHVDVIQPITGTRNVMATDKDGKVYILVCGLEGG